MNRPSFHSERLARTGRRAALRASLCASAVVAAGCGSSGAARPSEGPRPVVRSGPAPTPLPAPAAAVAFSYAAGSYRFLVTSEAAIELVADSGSRSETRSTVAQVTYRVGAGSTGMRTLTGTVDSFTVAPSPGVGGNGGVIGAPVAFRGTLDPARRQVVLQAVGAAPVATDCGTPNQLLFAIVREAIVVPPSPVRVGQSWEDSTTSTICRGDVPLTTRTLHRYKASGLVLYEGAQALHLTRSSSLELAGEGAQRGVALSVSGRGTGSADLFLDPALGRFLGGLSESDVELTVTIPERGPQRFRQRSRTRVETMAVGGRESGTRARPRAPASQRRPR